MAKKKVNNISSEGGPVFTGKVDNRGGQISGRSDKNHYAAERSKSLASEHRNRMIVAIIGAIAIIVGAIITATWPDLRGLLRTVKDFDALSGTWRGELAADGADSWGILLTISNNCDLYENCGTVQFSAIGQPSCVSSVVINSVQANRYEFGVSDLSGGCPPIDYQYVEWVNDNSLIYVFGWDDVEARGTLSRVP